MRFDLEEGPVVDFSFPSQNFSEEFIKKLAYPAFPDSYTQLCDDKMFFSFMIKAKAEDRNQSIYLSSQLKLAEMREASQSNQSPAKGSGPAKSDNDQTIIDNYNKSKKKQYLQGKHPQEASNRRQEGGQALQHEGEQRQ